VSRDLTPRALGKLLELAAPLVERPELGAVDTDRYELGAELGRGGMGVVYEAFDRELERVVALKVLTRPVAARGTPGGLSDESRQRFLREARAAARLVHPHIAAVYDATPEAIAMQRIRGETLAVAATRDPRGLAALVRDAALAIHFAHGEGVVHRDLKPANLRVEPGERPHVFVMDFGLAKELAVDTTVSMSGASSARPRSWPRSRPPGTARGSGRTRTSTGSARRCTRASRAGRRSRGAR
jgi:serine/threonine protein kinase